MHYFKLTYYIHYYGPILYHILICGLFWSKSCHYFSFSKYLLFFLGKWINIHLNSSTIRLQINTNSDIVLVQNIPDLYSIWY